MDGRGRLQGPGGQLPVTVPMAYDNGEQPVSLGADAQESKRGRDEAQPGPADDAKRRRQGEPVQPHQALPPAAAGAAEERLTQDELVRRAEDMLVELKRVATSAAVTWPVSPPTPAQLDSLTSLISRTVQYSKRAFPAAEAGLPLDQVPPRERHAVTLIKQAMDAAGQALTVYTGLQINAERSLASLTMAAVRRESAWRQAAPTEGQVAELQRRAETTRKLAAEVFPAAAAGLPAAQVPAREARAVELIVQAKAAVDRALSVAKDWQTRAKLQAEALVVPQAKAAILGMFIPLKQHTLIAATAWQTTTPTEQDIATLRAQAHTAWSLAQRAGGEWAAVAADPDVNTLVDEPMVGVQQALATAVRAGGPAAAVARQCLMEAHQWIGHGRGQGTGGGGGQEEGMGAAGPPAQPAAQAVPQQMPAGEVVSWQQQQQLGDPAVQVQPQMPAQPEAAAAAAAAAGHQQLIAAPTADQQPAEAAAPPVVVPAAHRLYTTPGEAMSMLLSAANALLPEPAASQPAGPVQELDQSGPAPTAAQLATWAKDAMHLLRQQTDTAILEWQTGKVPANLQLRRLRGKARSAVSLWQDAIATKGEDLGVAANASLLTLAEQATRVLRRALTAAQLACQTAAQRDYQQARLTAAEDACRALWRRALAAVAEWEQTPPTYQQAKVLQDEAERVQARVMDVWPAVGDRPGVVAWAAEAVLQALVIAAKAQAAREASATAACQVLTLAASSAFHSWQKGKFKDADLTALQAHADIVAGLIAEAWPDASQRPAVVQTTEAAVQTAKRAGQAAKERAEKQARNTAVTAALTKLRDDARATASAWQHFPPNEAEMQALEAVHTAAQAMVAESPDPPTHQALLDEATAAVAAARAAKERAEGRARVETALVALRELALKAVAAWQDRPASSAERAALNAAIRATQGVINAHPGLESPDTLRQAQEACNAAWAATDAAAAAAEAARAERRLAAEQALEAFTQRALLYAARWGRKGRRQPPKEQKYEKLLRESSRVLALVQREFPAAYAGPQVPEEEAHIETMLQEAADAEILVKRVVEAWRYAAAMHGAAVAA